MEAGGMMAVHVLNNLVNKQPLQSTRQANRGLGGSTAGVNRSSRLENITGMVVTKGIVVCNQTEGPATENLVRSQPRFWDSAGF